MSYRQTLSIVAVLASLGFVSRAGAQVGVLQESVSVNRAAGDATFTLDFPHSPDFFTVDAYGRPADSFQIDLAPANGNPLINPTAIIRGDEIQYLHMIAVRNVSPVSSDPHSGGYGNIRGTVPYSVNGSSISFTTPLSLINQPSGDFSYYAFTTHYGMTTAQASSRSVPLPPAFQAGMIMMAVGLLVGSIRRLSPAFHRSTRR